MLFARSLKRHIVKCDKSNMQKIYLNQFNIQVRYFLGKNSKMTENIRKCLQKKLINRVLQLKMVENNVKTLLKSII